MEKECQPENMKTSDQEMDEESVQHNVEATKVLEQNGSGEVKADSSCECGLTTEYIVDGLCSMRRDQRVIAMLMINIIMNYLLHRQQQQGNGDAK
ncbi:uncharacterized protein LOC133844195 isoform X2 [Drosophila sulfurigaster albostrigata]|uniref:uncharacterized protein LOC133844195 isoform X2 n=1 Tax=Drosophila sulfurigaster albostrigata TaxID=89887 RepID=UPI002D218E34|nr:uncharacterized protein LOC133844195 isoform X2 [Drosophila sulfurigaster albostrigata]